MRDFINSKNNLTTSGHQTSNEPRSMLWLKQVGVHSSRYESIINDLFANGSNAMNIPFALRINCLTKHHVNELVISLSSIATFTPETTTRNEFDVAKFI